MRKLFWMIIFFGVYVWLITSGKDEVVLDRAKQIYRACIAWLEDAEIDFQTKEKGKAAKKKARRWD